MLNRSAIAALLAFCAVALSACVTVDSTGSQIRGFDKASLTPGANLASYETVYIAPVEIAPSLLNRDRNRSRIGNAPRRVEERDLNKRAAYLQELLIREIGKTRNIVDAPGPTTLRIETVLSELQSSSPTLADLSDEPGLSTSSEYAGGATATFVLRDGTGQILGSLSDEYQANFNDSFRPAGIWTDANTAFRRWAKNLARAINR